MKYVYVGTESQVQSRTRSQKLQTFGQTIELEPAEADEWMRGGVALLPEPEFKDLDFATDHLKRYATPGAQFGAPEEFKTKLREARKRYSEKWQALEQEQREKAEKANAAAPPPSPVEPQESARDSQ